jgi:hypothetical protein
MAVRAKGRLFFARLRQTLGDDENKQQRVFTAIHSFLRLCALAPLLTARLSLPRASYASSCSAGTLSDRPSAPTARRVLELHRASRTAQHLHHGLH